MQIDYIGEQLFWGVLGNIFIFSAFVCALFSSVLYCVGATKSHLAKDLIPLARKFFYAHAFSSFGIFFLLMFLIFTHRFEYFYVWEHSNTAMPMRYIFACIWEGQEGSFLLWTLWHCVLVFFIIRNNKDWEAPVVGIITMVQVFLCSMLLGTYFFDYKIGSNPFTLLRDNPQFANLPFIQMPDYLQKLKDGRGLNPLLQNYWMVIHPPTLFLGFAATVVPFAFALGGLIKGKVTEWVKPALPYTFFGIMILGLGILMGAAWAYESLSFGGFWAWDPVENASLVPWITLVGAGHVMLIFSKRGRALTSSYVLCVISFLLILYSTFLTRSGILGDTSVHAFTDLGMSGHLLLYMGFFVLLAVILFIVNWKKIPKEKDDDLISSREFWMFIGMLVLCISAIQITFTTSIPVINKIFNTKFAPPVDVIEHYNSWQIPIAIIICVLLAIGQFFKFKESDVKQTLKKLSVSFVAALLITACCIYFLKFPRVHYNILLFASVFSIAANADYFLRVLKGKFSFSGASIAHSGIGFILLGALISNANSHIISQNKLNVDLGKDFPNNENIMLSKNDTLQMGNYYVTYNGRNKEGVNVFFDVEYFKLNNENGTLKKEFLLQPVIQLNDRMGNAAEPATERFLNKDIYTHITYADLDEFTKKEITSEYLAAHTDEMSTGDTIGTSNSLIILRGLTKAGGDSSAANDLSVAAVLDVIDANKKMYRIQPEFIIQSNMALSKNYFLDELGLKFRFTSINPETGKITLEVAEKKSNKRDFIIMKAIIFPHINLLWLGCILLVVGTWIAVRKRFKESVRYSEKITG